MAAAADASNPGQDALFGDQLILAAIERTQAKSYDPTTGNTEERATTSETDSEQ